MRIRREIAGVRIPVSLACTSNNNEIGLMEVHETLSALEGVFSESRSAELARMIFPEARLIM